MPAPLPPNKKEHQITSNLITEDLDLSAASMKLSIDRRADLASELIASLPVDIRENLLSNPVPSRSRVRINQQYAYVVKVSQKGTTLAFFIHLVHRQSFSQEEIDSFCQEASKITMDVRMKRIREQIASTKKSIEGSRVETINEEFFTTHVSYLEGVLCDKHDFKRLHISATSCEIEPTISMGR